MSEETRAEEIERRVAEGDVVVVHQLSDQFEEQEICQALGQEGIVYEVRRSYDTAFSFLFSPQKGYGVLLCRSSDAQQVTTLIAALAASEPQLPSASAPESSGD
jgi:hypothetical protein